MEKIYKRASEVYIAVTKAYAKSDDIFVYENKEFTNKVSAIDLHDAYNTGLIIVDDLENAYTPVSCKIDESGTTILCVVSNDESDVDCCLKRLKSGSSTSEQEPEESYPTDDSIIEVGKGEFYTYNSIKDAEAAAKDGDTILIHEGTYEEWGIGTVNKELTYEGVNKETCIVENGLSDKMYSVFDLADANKIVKNLTIHQTHSNPQNPDTSTVAYKAYAVHVDTESNIGHTYTIENCILKNRYFACTGIGLWQDTNVIVKDCDLDLYDSNRDITGSGAYYCHCNTNATGVTGQRISLINNNIHAYQSKAIRIDCANQEGSEMICEFINNTCSSDLYGDTNECVSFEVNDHTTLSETSSGNSVSVLNYDIPSAYVAPDGLKDTGYWFVVYNKSKDEYYCGNADKTITECYKSASMLLFVKTSETAKSINGWKSSDGQNWTQVTTNQTCYDYKIKTNASEDTNSAYAFCSSQYNDVIELIDAWSDTEFTWNY